MSRKKKATTGKAPKPDSVRLSDASESPATKNMAHGPVGGELVRGHARSHIQETAEYAKVLSLTLEKWIPMVGDELKRLGRTWSRWTRMEEEKSSGSRGSEKAVRLCEAFQVIQESLGGVVTSIKNHIDEVESRMAELERAVYRRAEGKTRTLVELDMAKSELMTRLMSSVVKSDEGMLLLQKNMLEFIEMIIEDFEADDVERAGITQENFGGDGMRLSFDRASVAIRFVEYFFQALEKSNKNHPPEAQWHFRAFAATGRLLRGTSTVKGTSFDTGMLQIDFARIARSDNCLPGQFLIDQATFDLLDSNSQARFSSLKQVAGKHKGSVYTVRVRTFLPPPQALT